MAIASVGETCTFVDSILNDTELLTAWNQLVMTTVYEEAIGPAYIKALV